MHNFINTQFFFYLKFTLYFSPFILSGLWMMKSEKEFMRLYQKIKNPQVSTSPEKISKKYANSPSKFINYTPKLTLKFIQEFWRKHNNKELDAAAYQVRKRIYITLSIWIGFNIILFLLVFNGLV